MISYFKAFPGAPASFGFTPYGKIVLGSAHLSDPIEACGPLEPVKYDEQYDVSPIIVVKRGKCSFVTKSYYAQIAGAKAVIIIDNLAS